MQDLCKAPHGSCGYREGIFTCVSYYKNIVDDDAGAYIDPRGTVGRIYKENHCTLLHTNMDVLGLVFSKKKILYVCPLVSLWKLIKRLK